MKIVKLNRNFKVNKFQGHTYGLRFDGYSDICTPIVRYLENVYGPSPFQSRLNSYQESNRYPWAGWFGARYKTHRQIIWMANGDNRMEVTKGKFYWITLRDPAMLTALLLQFDIKSE